MCWQLSWLQWSSAGTDWDCHLPQSAVTSTSKLARDNSLLITEYSAVAGSDKSLQNIKIAGCKVTSGANRKNTRILFDDEQPRDFTAQFIGRNPSRILFGFLGILISPWHDALIIFQIFYLLFNISMNELNWNVDQSGPHLMLITLHY